MIVDPPPRSAAPGLTLRRARTDDVPQIQSMVREAYTKYIDRIGKPPAPMSSDYTQLLNTHEVFVLENDDNHTVVGSIVLGLDGGSDSIKINNVVVDPAAQGKGYGRILMNYAEDFAQAQEKPALTLFTNVKMFENLTLYPKMGFLETERRTEDGYERVYFRKDLA